MILGCGKPNNNGLARIVNGFPTAHIEFPWMAALHRTGPFRKNRDSLGGFCGGVLISDLYILTAAHCIYRYLRRLLNCLFKGLNLLIGHIYSKMSINIDSRLHNSQFKVILAQHSPSYPSGHEEEFFVSKKLIHKDFNHNNYHNDIAVIKLNRRVQFSRHIRPVCVPTVGNEIRSKLY